MTAPGKVEPQMSDQALKVLTLRAAARADNPFNRKVRLVCVDLAAARAALAASEERIKALEAYIDLLESDPGEENTYPAFREAMKDLQSKIGRTEDGRWEGR